MCLEGPSPLLQRLMSSHSPVHWNSYPALGLAGCFAVGIIAATGLPEVPALVWGIGAAGSVLSGLGALWWTGRRLVSLAPLAVVAAVGASVLLAGAAWTATMHTHPPHHLSHWLAGDEAVTATVVGTIRDAPSTHDGTSRFTVEVDRIVRLGAETSVTGRVRASLRPSAWDRGPPFPTVQQRDSVQLTGRLQPPPPRRNPADFDYGAYLERQGVHATLGVYHADDVTVLGHERSSMRQWVVDARTHVGSQLDTCVSHKEAQAVLRALLLGDRSRIAPDTRDRFAYTGLMHLLAVSGLHVLLVGMVLYNLLRPLLLRFRMRWSAMEISRAALTMGVLIFYMVLTGARPSVVRAVVMAGVLIGGVLAQRSSHALNALGVAGLILLVARPTMLFDVGFQLSFAAVAVIVTLNPRFQALLPELWVRRPLVERTVLIVTVSLAATLGTMPVLLYHFGYSPWGGLVLNIIAIPATALTLTGGLALAVLGGGSSLLATGFGAAAELSARLLLLTATWGEQLLGWAVLRMATPEPWLLLAIVAGLIAGAQWPRLRLRWRWSLLAVGLVAASVWTGVMREEGAPRLEMIVFDVGHGDAILIELPNGGHMLVDAGLRAPHVDHGTRTVLPHLQRYGIDQLDTVVISHPHADHFGGLLSVLEAMPVNRVVYNGYDAFSGLYREKVALIDSLDVHYQPAQAGDTLQVDPAVVLQVLAPPKEVHTWDLATANEQSVVLRLVYGETTFLLTGDAEEATETWLVEAYGDLLSSDVVKVGHHGSPTSSTPVFVERVTSDSTRSPLAVISAPHNSLFGLPSPDVMARWTEHNAQLWWTARDQAVWLESDGNKVTFRRW